MSCTKFHIDPQYTEVRVLTFYNNLNFFNFTENWMGFWSRSSKTKTRAVLWSNKSSYTHNEFLNFLPFIFVLLKKLHGYRAAKYLERIGQGIDGKHREREHEQAIRDDGHLQGLNLLQP